MEQGRGARNEERGPIHPRVRRGSKGGATLTIKADGPPLRPRHPGPPVGQTKEGHLEFLARVLSPPRGSLESGFRSPRLTPWAKFFRPLLRA